MDRVHALLFNAEGCPAHIAICLVLDERQCTTFFYTLAL